MSFVGGGSEWTALVTAEGYLHPTAAAHSALAWLLEDTHFVKRTEPASGVDAYLFTGAGRSVAVLAGKPPHAAYTIPHPTGATVTDLFGNPVPAGTRLTDELVYLAAPRLDELEKGL